jgi:hypothetical protein
VQLDKRATAYTLSTLSCPLKAGLLQKMSCFTLLSFFKPKMLEWRFKITVSESLIQKSFTRSLQVLITNFLKCLVLSML